MVIALGLVSAVVMAIVGVKTDGFGLQTHAEWDRYAADLAATGEPVLFDAMVPPPVPEEENLFFDPLFAPLVTPGGASSSGSLLAMAVNPGSGLSVESLLESSTDGNGRATLDAIAGRMMAAGVTNPKTDYLLPGDRILAGLQQAGFDFSPLENALVRRKARFPVDYSNVGSPELPHLTSLESLGDWLAIRAIASISTGNSASAANDLLMVARLADATANEPYLESQRTRRKLLDIFCSGVLTGIQRDTWSEAELVSFRAAMQRANPTDDLLLAIRGERTRLNSAIDGALFREDESASPLIETWIGAPASAFRPKEVRRNQIVVNTAIQQLIDRVAKPEAATTEPAPVVLDLPITARERLAVLEEEFETSQSAASKVAEADAACANAGGR
ncbi:MAG: hypothetical protein ACOVMP_05010 [Chthoniobacterales bacterium]